MFEKNIACSAQVLPLSKEILGCRLWDISTIRFDLKIVHLRQLFFTKQRVTTRLLFLSIWYMVQWKTKPSNKKMSSQKNTIVSSRNGLPARVATKNTAAFYKIVLVFSTGKQHPSSEGSCREGYKTAFLKGQPLWGKHIFIQQNFAQTHH